MKETNTPSNLGVPIAVDVDAIEQKLTGLWKSASQSGNESAVMRACSCNVVVVVRDGQEAESLPDILAKVAEWHPCRSLIAYRHANGTGVSNSPSMSAWLRVVCSMAVAGGPQVCCETITVASGGNAIAILSNTLVSLLIPDLPVFLYWRSFKTPEQPLVGNLAQFCDVLIVDSHESKDDPANREYLLEFLTALPNKAAVRDLNWSRLTAWRDLIAQFFDPPAYRHYAREISEVEVCRAVAAPGNIPTRALLLTGWLASRLQWQLISAERNLDLWVSRWKSPTGDVIVRFTGESGDKELKPGIASVRLRTRSGASFAVAQERGAACTTATSEAQGSTLHHSVPRESDDEAVLLIQELSVTGEDTGFKLALKETLALERAFH
jgi:glucose-6-phosphate dehydrogenase assembly protein OpcA